MSSLFASELGNGEAVIAGPHWILLLPPVALEDAAFVLSAVELWALEEDAALVAVLVPAFVADEAVIDDNSSLKFSSWPAMKLGSYAWYVRYLGRMPRLLIASGISSPSPKSCG